MEFFRFFGFKFIAVIDDLIFFIGIDGGFGIRVFGQDIGVEQEEQDNQGEGRNEKGAIDERGFEAKMHKVNDNEEGFSD